jgi:serine/threonine protein kinase
MVAPVYVPNAYAIHCSNGQATARILSDGVSCPTRTIDHVSLAMYTLVLQVLVTTVMKRSDSIASPDLFHYQEHFHFLATIGETKSSQVFKVAHRQTGEIFAVKRSRKRFRTKMQRERCLREIQMVASLPEHENIVAQYRAWQEGGHFYIQMDYCDGGSLQQYLERQPGGRLGSKEELWGVVADVASGLQFLHGNGVLHLDIKPENLYTKKATRGTSVWKIGDFGLAIGKEATDWEEGDGDYVAPELLRTLTEQPHPAADIFSLGATVYQCATGRKLPRCVGSPNADLSLVTTSDGEFTAVDDDVRSLLRAMTLEDPRMRPSASQVLQYAEAVMAGSERPLLTAEGTAEERMKVDALLASGKELAFSEDEGDAGYAGYAGDVGDVGVNEMEDADANDIDDGITVSTAPTTGSNPSKDSNPPKLPLLNLKIPQAGMKGNHNGLSSASNSFRIMRRELSDTETTDYGSLSERTDMGDDVNDMVSPRSHRDGGLFGPLSSRLLRGHGSLTFESPDVNISSGGSDPTMQVSQKKGHKSQSRTEYLQGTHGMHGMQGNGRGENSNPPQMQRAANRLTVWNEFEDGSGGHNGINRYRSPFADEGSLSARGALMGKENSVATMAEKNPGASAMTTGKKKPPPHVPLLPIQSNKVASKQTFGKKRQHSYRNSARSARSSHRSNDLNLSARSIDALMPPKTKTKQTGIESLHGELNIRMKI